MITLFNKSYFKGRYHCKRPKTTMLEIKAHRRLINSPYLMKKLIEAWGDLSELD